MVEKPVGKQVMELLCFLLYFLPSLHSVTTVAWKQRPNNGFLPQVASGPGLCHSNRQQTVASALLTLLKPSRDSGESVWPVASFCQFSFNTLVDQLRSFIASWLNFGRPHVLEICWHYFSSIVFQKHFLMILQVLFVPENTS